ncbi:MAG: GNAT family N-acetyltransferase [Gemmatimonadaceae bacterium]
MPSIETSSPSSTTADAIVTAGLHAHLDTIWEEAGRVDVSVYLRDDDGAVIGGIIGRVAWRWLYVQRLWVDAAHRGRGHGAAILDAAEQFAIARGCIGSHLDTFGEEALPFYRRRGYTVWGTLEGFPPGGRQHALKKELSSPADGA